MNDMRLFYLKMHCILEIGNSNEKEIRRHPMKKYNNTIKIMTYNIHGGKNFWMIPKLKDIMLFLKKEKPHIIGIQEINENSKNGFQVSKIKQNLNMNAHFAPNVIRGNGYYGVATFTNLSMKENKHILLPSKIEKRGFIDTVVTIDNKEIHILNTHLALAKNIRKNQFKALVNYIQSLKSPCILMGDLNTIQPEIEDDLLMDTAKIMKKEYLPTFMFSNKRIDYIFSSKTLKVIHYSVSFVTMSDHYPVCIEVSI